MTVGEDECHPAWRGRREGHIKAHQEAVAEAMLLSCVLIAAVHHLFVQVF